MSKLRDILEKQRNCLDVYVAGNERIPKGDLEQFVFATHTTLCHLIKHLDQSDAIAEHLRKRVQVLDAALDEIASTFPGHLAAKMAEAAINWKETPDESNLPPRTAD